MITRSWIYPHYPSGGFDPLMTRIIVSENDKVSNVFDNLSTLYIDLLCWGIGGDIVIPGVDGGSFVAVGSRDKCDLTAYRMKMIL